MNELRVSHGLYQSVHRTIFGDAAAVTLKEIEKENLMKGTLLLAGFGVSYSWGGVIINCKTDDY